MKIRIRSDGGGGSLFGLLFVEELWKMGLEWKNEYGIYTVFHASLSLNIDLLTFLHENGLGSSSGNNEKPDGPEARVVRDSKTYKETVG